MASTKWLISLLSLTQALHMVEGASIPTRHIEKRADGVSELGCFTDSSSWWRVLVPVETVVSDSMTIELCSETCSSYDIFSVKDGDTVSLLNNLSRLIF